MSEWQPMHTVPTDGTPFLFCAVGAQGAVFAGKFAPSSDGSPVLFYCSYTDTRDLKTERHGGMIRCALTPLYWMHLPKPPAGRCFNAHG